MGEAEDSHAEAHDLSGGSQKDRSGSESTVGEGEALRLRCNDAPMQQDA
jgi:hypothetical protein